MLCDVVLLRDHGKRLRPSELQPPVRGMLSIGDNSDPTGGSFKRAGRVARLRGAYGAGDMRSGLLVPLFDPQILHIGEDSDVITLIGIELSSARHDGDLRVCEHMQVWRCAPVLSGQ